MENLKSIFRKKENFLLFTIFLLSLFLRIYRLDGLPNAFFGEEVTNAYATRFIFLNGKDLYGNAWPLLYFDKFGDYPPILPLYLIGLPTFIFGVNEFGSRFATSLFGALTVFPMYALAMLVFGDKKISLFSALFIAIVPWHIVLSRTGGEGIIGFIVFATAILLALKGILEKHKAFILWSFVFFFLTYFLYPSLRILTPLAILPLPFLVEKSRTIKKLFIGAIVFFLALTLAIGQTDWGKARFVQTSLFHSPEIQFSVKNRLEGLSNDDGRGNVLLARTFHNKVVAYTREFAKQYFDYFSFRHLFLEAGGQRLYYNVPDQGLLYLTLAPLILFALLPLHKKLNHKLFVYFLFLLVISPIPAALTIDFPPHVHRSIFMLLPLIIVMCYGLYKVQDLGYRKVTADKLLLTLLLLEFFYFWHQYSRHEASLQSVLRSDGQKQVSLSVAEKVKDYEKIYMSVLGRMPLYVLFFTNNFDPSLAGKFKKDLKIDNIGSIQFLDNECPSKAVRLSELPKRSLIVDGGDCENKDGLKEIELILRRDSTRAYKFLVPQI